MNSTDLDGRVALVTGAAGGIGRPLCRAFVEAGMRVALCDTSGEGLLRLQDELGADRTLLLPIDVSDPDSCSDGVNRTIARFGHVDVLVNNAAVGMSTVRADHMRRVVQIEDISPALWARFMAVNLSAPFYMARAAVPGMRAQSFGRIINVTTSYFTMLNPGFSPYGPAKSGLDHQSCRSSGGSPGCAGSLREQHSRQEDRGAEREIGPDHAPRIEKEEGRETDAQPVGIEPEILPDRLTDPEDRVVAGQEVRSGAGHFEFLWQWRETDHADTEASPVPVWKRRAFSGNWYFRRMEVGVPHHHRST